MDGYHRSSVLKFINPAFAAFHLATWLEKPEESKVLPRLKMWKHVFLEVFQNGLFITMVMATIKMMKAIKISKRSSALMSVFHSLSIIFILLYAFSQKVDTQMTGAFVQLAIYIYRVSSNLQLSLDGGFYPSSSSIVIDGILSNHWWCKRSDL